MSHAKPPKRRRRPEGHGERKPRRSAPEGAAQAPKRPTRDRVLAMAERWREEADEHELAGRRKRAAYLRRLADDAPRLVQEAQNRAFQFDRAWVGYDYHPNGWRRHRASK